MTEIRDIYNKYINDKLVLVVASNPVSKDGCTKLRVRPITLKGSLYYQVTRTVGPKEIHENLSAEAAVEQLEAVTGAEPGQFKQVEVKNQEAQATILVSKKGKATIKEKKAQFIPALSLDTNNRTKNYIIPEGKPVPFLVDLGVMTEAGKIVAQRYDKFRQINRYLEFVEDILPSLPKNREVSIIDFGCGKSYLTFALYYYLHEVKGYDIRVTGLDLKADVIKKCSELAKSFGYDKLSFLHGDIADYTGTDSVDMVVTLHACDTATDYALYKAIKWNAKVIFCVPCCQHELNKQIKNDMLGQVLKYGLIKERMAALLTDGMRACMLEEQGYKTQVLEFIDMEHTPKNILIRAVKQPKLMKPSSKKDESGVSKAAGFGYTELMKELNGDLTLHRLLTTDEE